MYVKFAAHTRLVFRGVKVAIPDEKKKDVAKKAECRD